MLEAMRQQAAAMQAMTAQFQQFQEQLKAGHQRMTELQNIVQHQASVIHELQARSRSPSPSHDPSVTQALIQAVTKFSEVVEKMEDRGGTVDMKNVGKPFTFRSNLCNLG